MTPKDLRREAVAFYYKFPTGVQLDWIETGSGEEEMDADCVACFKHFTKCYEAGLAQKQPEPAPATRKQPRRWRSKEVHPVHGVVYGCYFPGTDLNVGNGGGRGTGAPQDVEWLDSVADIPWLKPAPDAPQPCQTGPAPRSDDGPMRFGDDWTGLFLRGDTCFAVARALERLMALVPEQTGIEGVVAVRMLQGHLSDLDSTNEHKADMTERQNLMAFKECQLD